MENPTDEYSKCVCPEGRGGDNCQINEFCNKRASFVSGGYNEEDNNCDCIGVFRPYRQTRCVCPKDDVNGVDLGLGFKENCCGEHGSMKPGDLLCTCDDGFNGNNCENETFREMGCKDAFSDGVCPNYAKFLEDNPGTNPDIAVRYGGGSCACGWYDESEQFHFCKPTVACE
jgi:hypothetical protein